MMRYLLAFFLFLGLTSFAQEDPYQSLAPGDRLQVTFRSGGSLIGTLVPPPSAGAAAVQKKKVRAVDVKAAATPFRIIFIYNREDGATAAQEAILEQWMKGHPEGALSKLVSDDKAAQELAQQHKVAATPAVLFLDNSVAISQVSLGMVSIERLDAGLLRLRTKVEEAKVDYTKEAFLTLDVSLEYPGLNGTLSLARKDIKELRKLQKLDEATRRRLEEERRKISESQAADENARREAELKRTENARLEAERAAKEAEEAALKGEEIKALEAKAAKLKAGAELLKQFPPEKWGDEKIKEIGQKSLNRLPVTPEERQFLEKHKEWLEAVKAKESEKKEKPPEEGSGEKK